MLTNTGLRSYESPHRLNTSVIYPIQSPQGATIIVSGYDDGLHLVWKGGKPMRQASRSLTQKRDMPVSIHERDETTQEPLVTQPISPDGRPGFESDNEEAEDDDLQPSLTQELKLSMASPVLHLAIPSLPPSSSAEYNPNLPKALQTRIVVVAACADGSVRLVTLPLTPPTTISKLDHRLDAHICDLAPAGTRTTPRAVSLTWTRTAPESGKEIDLLIALAMSSIAAVVNFYRIPIPAYSTMESRIPNEARPFQTVPLNTTARHISFSLSPLPSSRHSHLLIADTKGSVRVYDPLATESPESSRSRPASREDLHDADSASGSWIVSLHTPFYAPKDTDNPYPGLGKRKEILDARWLSVSNAILVLLDDGEWGVWSVDGVGLKANALSAGTPITEFAIRGFIGDSSNTYSSAVPSVKNRASSKLAPMTPNTRRARQESLFTGPTTTVTGQAPRGGISVSPAYGHHNDDSVVLWYGNEAFHIPSLGSLWKRSISSSGRETGSLYGPDLSRIEGLDLSGELLNDVAQFAPRSAAVSIGSITQRDMLVVGEYHLIIVTSPRLQVPAKSLFARDNGSPTKMADQSLLDSGELDIGGLDRLLEGMNGANGFGKAKRVGFSG